MHHTHSAKLETNSVTEHHLGPRAHRQACQRRAVCLSTLVQACTSALDSMQGSQCLQLQRPLLLSADMDDTMIGDRNHDSGTAAFRDMWQRSRESGSHRCLLAYNTGRTLPLYEDAWYNKKHVLAEPDVLILGVGTRVYHKTPTGWQEDMEWTAHVGEGWDLNTAEDVINKAIKRFGADKVVYRESSELHEHKLTALFTRDIHQPLLALLRQELAAAGMQATIIEGGVGDTPWRFIDLVPKNAGKGSAMRYLQRVKFDFQDHEVVAAGDSCNDLLMLDEAHYGIIVSNCVPEVRHWALQRQREQQEQHGQRRLYIANQPVANGVLEGLSALGFVAHC